MGLQGELTEAKKQYLRWKHAYTTVYEQMQVSQWSYQTKLNTLLNLLKYPKLQDILYRRMYFSAKQFTEKHGVRTYKDWWDQWIRCDRSKYLIYDSSHIDVYLGRMIDDQVILEKDTNLWWCSSSEFNMKDGPSKWWTFDDSVILTNYIAYNNIYETNAVKTIQRNWRRFLERPFYPNGRIGLYSRKNFEQLIKCFSST